MLTACPNPRLNLAFQPERPRYLLGQTAHEIKHDGYHLFVQRDGKRVRLFTRNGHDWSGRFPLITEAALRNRNSSFVIDGEAVCSASTARSDFNGLHSREHDDEVEFYAFEMPGERRRGSPQATAVDAQDQSGPAAGPSREGIFLGDFERARSAQICFATPA